jgi:hypothetical protein
MQSDVLLVVDVAAFASAMGKESSTLSSLSADEDNPKLKPVLVELEEKVEDAYPLPLRCSAALTASESKLREDERERAPLSCLPLKHFRHKPSAFSTPVSIASSQPLECPVCVSPLMQ